MSRASYLLKVKSRQAASPARRSLWQVVRRPPCSPRWRYAPALVTLRLQPELGGALALHEDLAPAASTSCERSASIATVHGADRASTVAVHSERTACPSGPRAGMFVSSTTLRSAGLAWSALNARHRKILIVCFTFCFQSFWARGHKKQGWAKRP